MLHVNTLTYIIQVMHVSCEHTDLYNPGHACFMWTLTYIIIIIIIITLSTEVSERSNCRLVRSLLKGISWSQRVSNLVGHSFCEHIGLPSGVQPTELPRPTGHACFMVTLWPNHLPHAPRWTLDWATGFVTCMTYIIIWPIYRSDARVSYSDVDDVVHDINFTQTKNVCSMTIMPVTMAAGNRILERPGKEEIVFNYSSILTRYSSRCGIQLYSSVDCNVWFSHSNQL